MIEMDDITLLRYVEDDLSSEDRTIARALIAQSPLLQEKIRILKSTAQLLEQTFHRSPASRAPKETGVVERVHPAAMATRLTQRQVLPSAVQYSILARVGDDSVSFHRRHAKLPQPPNNRRSSISVGNWRYGIAPAIVLGVLIGGFGAAYIFQTPETTLTVADSTAQSEPQSDLPKINSSANSLASRAEPETTRDNEYSFTSPSESEAEQSAVSLTNNRVLPSEIRQAFGEDFAVDDAQFPTNWKARMFADNQANKVGLFPIGNDQSLNWRYISQFELSDGATCRKVKVELIETSATRIVVGCVLPGQTWDQANVSPFTE